MNEFVIREVCSDLRDKLFEEQIMKIGIESSKSRKFEKMKNVSIYS